MSRSFLFVPGDVPRMLQNLDVFDADNVIIDFEDAISIKNKPDARHLTHSFLKQFSIERPNIYIRINASDSPFFNEDISILSDLPVKGIVLPKTELSALKKLEGELVKHHLEFDVIALIETPKAFFQLEHIAHHKLVKGLLLGGEDLSREIGATRTQEGQEILFARSQVIFAAKSAQILAIDTPYVGLHDDEGLTRDALQAKRLGFDAKAVIHPNHVEIINQQFMPTKEEVTQAKRIVTESERTQSVRFTLDGRMVDQPIIEKAKDIIKKDNKYRKK